MVKDRHSMPTSDWLWKTSFGLDAKAHPKHTSYLCLNKSLYIINLTNISNNEKDYSFSHITCTSLNGM